KILEGTKEPASVRAEARGIALPKGFDAWFAKATALKRAERFDSASELVEGLAQALRREPPSTMTHPLPTRTEPSESLRKLGEAETLPQTESGGAERTAPMESQQTLPM